GRDRAGAAGAPADAGAARARLGRDLRPGARPALHRNHAAGLLHSADQLPPRAGRQLMLTPPHLLFFLLVFLVALTAGVVGALAGIGGGILVVPALTLLFGVDIRLAIGASIVSVIATSSGAAAAYIRDRITNLRVGMVMEVATTIGAICGAFLAGVA